MKISPLGGAGNNDRLQKNADSKAASDRSQANAPSVRQSGESKEDQIRISTRAREVHRIAEIVKAAPDVRAEKIREIKQAVQSGTYAVPSAQVAEKILQDIQANFLGL